MDFKSIIKGTAIAVAGIVITGCASTSNPMTEAIDDSKDIKMEFVKTGDTKVDKCGASMAVLYGQTATILKEYIEMTEANPKYSDALDKVRDAESKDVKPELTPEEQAAVAAVKNNPFWKKVMPKVPSLLASGKTLSEDASGMTDAFSGFDATTLEKIASVKNMAAQGAMTVGFLGLLTEEYAYFNGILK